MSRYLIALAVLATVFSLAAACGGDEKTDPTPTTRTTSPPTVPTSAVPTPTDTPTPVGTPLTSVNEDPGGSGQYRFNPPAVYTFKLGDIVTFTLIAETEFHTFTVPELEIDVEMNAGETKTLTYTFDKPGEFELICTSHELQGMTGSITVLP